MTRLKSYITDMVWLKYIRGFRLANKALQQDTSVCIHKEPSRDEVHEVFNVLLEQMSSHLAKGGHIEVRGFGSFHVKQYKGERSFPNPRADKDVNPRIVRKQRNRVHFKASKALKRDVNKEKSGKTMRDYIMNVHNF